MALLKTVEPFTHGRYLAEDMMEEVYRERSWCIGIFETDERNIQDVIGVVICTKQVYPRKTNVLVQWAAGDKSHLWRHNVKELLVQLAETEKCFGIEAEGRRGWSRWFPEWEPQWVMGEIALGGGRKSKQSADDTEC